MQRLRVFILAILLIGTVMATVAAHAAPSAGITPVLVDTAGGGYNGIEVTLAADAAPVPGGTVTLTLTARPLHDAPNVYVEWELPDGGALLGGPVEETLGPVAAGQSVTITRQARFDAASVYEVSARAYYFPNPATSLAAVGVLFFDVRTNNPTASDLDPRTPIYEPPSAKRTVDKSHLSGTADRAADGCFNVSGTLVRANKLPYAEEIKVPPRPVPVYKGVYLDQNGSAAPVRNVVVELREEDTVSDDSYGHTVTSDLGRFTFNFCDGDGALDDELELYYRVCAEVRAGSTLIAQVREHDSRNLYCWDSPVLESDGGNVDFDLQSYDINSTQAKVFNIADAVYWAWRFWNSNATQSPAFDRSVTVWWQDGKEDGSYYSDNSTAMVIAGDPSDRDEWDDSVIIHEWGHFADHQFSCNQNPGGDHALPGMNNGYGGQRLAWGEGYPDYYQSAARSIMPNTDSIRFYVDPSGPTVDLENMAGVTASERDEGAIAAMLWDFFDTANDGQDTVSHGHAAIQRAYAAADFKNTLNCDVSYFLGMWRKLGLPADAATAATVAQNVKLDLLTTTAPPTPTGAAGNAPSSVLPPQSALAAPPLQSRWWDQVTMVVDTSASMAQPTGTPKIDSVKAIIKEQVNDLAPSPRGVEFNLYSFDSATPLRNEFERRFFANRILPEVNALAATGPDSGCTVNGLNSLSLAAADKYDGQVWLYTDGDEFGFTSPEPLRQALNERRLRGSVVLLGGCSAPPTKQSNVTGPERTYLDLAADGSQPTGMVPYLLTALGSGGQFIYVSPDQLANAIDIVRAQLGHSAGAGRWSDYVSNVYTYRWDRLEPWEYDWMPNDLAQDAGQFQKEDTPLRLTPPAPIPFYGGARTTLDVYLDGFIRMNPCVTFPDCPDFTQKFVNPLYANLDWKFVGTGPRRPAEAPAAAEEDGYQVHAYTTNYADQWYIVSTEGIADYNPDPQIGEYDYRGFQVWFNYVSGEIRFLYNKLRNEAGSALIGLENDTVLFKAGNVVVSQNDLAGATSGMGYKFTPAPPQPARVYDVNVDPLIESVIFLQTGYSGDFAPMIVTDPDGAAVNCNDTANVRCLTMDNQPGDRMVQFVQVNTNGKSGIYTATVAVGPSGSGTFSFNALAASSLQASSPGRHTLSLDNQLFTIDLGRPVAGNVLDGWLQTPAGAAFGEAFQLYDDGTHQDSVAGDGRFVSAPYSPPRAGAAYLWVKGAIDGVEFRRSDPAPFNFQPLEVSAKTPYVEDFYNNGLYIHFDAVNQDSVEHCYRVEFTVPDGWYYDDWPWGSEAQCIPAGESISPYVLVGRDATPDSLGEVGEVGFSLIEDYEGSIAGVASTRLALTRRPVAMEFDTRQVAPLRPNSSDTLELTLRLVDDLGQTAAFNGPFDAEELSATLGTIAAPTGMFEDGRLKLIFTAGNTTGMAMITARMGNMTATTTVEIAASTPDSIHLDADLVDLTNSDIANLTVTVRDAYSEPVAGQTIRLSVSDDEGAKGTIGGEEVFEGATDVNGRMKAKFTKTAGATGDVVVRAELLNQDGLVVRETSIVLRLSAPPAERRLFLPIMTR